MDGRFAPPDWREFYPERTRAARVVTLPVAGQGPAAALPPELDTILARHVRRTQPGGVRPVRNLAGAAVLASGAVLFAVLVHVLVLPVWRTQGTGVLPGAVVLPVLLLSVLAPFAGALVVWRWLEAVRANAEVLSPGAHHARSRSWTRLAWIAPVVSWWFPYQVVRDVARASSPAAPDASGPLLATWWALWLGALATGGVAVPLTRTASVLPGVEVLGTAMSVVCAALALGAFALWVRLVARITELQETPRQVVLPDTAAFAAARA
ncbi:hypothetical protein NUM3379_19970 [Kineococcus sp. NUM-3379]